MTTAEVIHAASDGYAKGSLNAIEDALDEAIAASRQLVEQLQAEQIDRAVTNTRPLID